jgi:hypothetical protein
MISRLTILILINGQLGISIPLIFSHSMISFHLSCRVESFDPSLSELGLGNKNHLLVLESLTPLVFYVWTVKDYSPYKPCHHEEFGEMKW